MTGAMNDGLRHVRVSSEFKPGGNDAKNNPNGQKRFRNH
jgi:hypothetical protein